MYGLVVLVYAAYPLAGYLTLGREYTPSNDNRLWAIQPDLATVLLITGYGAAHLLSFIITYLLLRGHRAVVPPRTTPPRLGAGAVAVYLAVTVFFVVLGAVYDLSAGNYTETYLIPTRLPLLLAQLFVQLSGLRLTLKLTLLLCLFVHYRKYRWALWLWLITEALLSVTRMGSRTEMVLLTMAALMLYHSYVRRVRFFLFAAMAMAGFIGFIVLGAVRAGARVHENLNLFMYASECESIFANAVDLQQHRSAGQVEPLPMAFYLNDFLALVPQQLLPVQKVDPGRWYAETFYRAYAEQGGAFAFGTVPLAVLGGGWPDVALRGVALGVAFGLLHRSCARRSSRFWVSFCYLWLVVLCYQSFRSSTFYLLVLFEYRVAPAIVLVTVGAKALRALRPVRPALPTLVPQNIVAAPQ